MGERDESSFYLFSQNPDVHQRHGRYKKLPLLTLSSKVDNASVMFSMIEFVLSLFNLDCSFLPC